MRRAVEGSNRPGYRAIARLVAAISPQKSGFDPRPVRVGIVVDKVAGGQVPPPAPTTSISHIGIIPPMLRTHSVIYHRSCII